MREITRELARFAVNTRFEDLLPSILKETKLILMEHIGTALGALTTDKGKMMAALGRRYGGPPEASIIGQADKVSCVNAALANGELMITLDYSDIIAGGHDGTYVIPTVLAAAELAGASGKDLILATALGLEISARLARAVGRHNITPEAVRRARGGGPGGLTGNAYSNFGAAAGAGRLMKFDEAKVLHAMGVAGHLCMVLSYGRWGAGGHRYMAKYGVPGWQSTGAVTAVMLAEIGYTGDTTVLDDTERGFTYFTGYPCWYPEEITDKLGEEWIFNIRAHYKPYPCCGAFHCVLDCFYDIIEPNKLMPEEIQSVTTYSRGAMPASKEIHGISGAQFNMPYNMGVLAHRVPRGVEWVDPDTMKNPAILSFIDKVTVKPHPDYLKELENDPLTNLAKVEVAARGKTFVVERKYRRGTVGGTEVLPSDDQFLGKFKHNAERILTKDKIERAAESLMNLEKLNNVSELMRQVTL